MPILAIFTCMLYGAISGSAPGTTAAVGAMCFPLLVRLGYDRVFSAAIIVGAGCLGTVIPPSIQVTGMGVLSGGLELVALYKLAAIMGIACGVMIMIYSYVYCLRHGNGDQALINGKVTSLAWVLLVFRVSLPSYRYSHSWSRVPLAPCVGIKSCKSERKSEKTDVFDVKK